MLKEKEMFSFVSIIHKTMRAILPLKTSLLNRLRELCEMFRNSKC